MRLILEIVFLAAIPLADVGEIPLTVEHGMRLSDSAFVADLEWYDVETPYENIINASGRVHPVRLLWGQLPPTPVEIGRLRFLRHGGSRVPTVWDFLSPKYAKQFSIIALTRGADANLEFMFVLGGADAPVPCADEVQAIRTIESRADSTELREDLIQLVLNPRTPDLLWKYALRRLFLLDDDPSRRFDLLLDSRIQSQTSSDRLYYATMLLSGREIADLDKYRLMELPGMGVVRVRVTKDEVRMAQLRLIGILETTASADMAEVALWSFLSGTVNNALSDKEWAEIRVRIRAALANAEHPLNKLPPDRHENFQRNLARVMREPNPFSPGD